MTKRSMTVVTASVATLLAILAPTPLARADIFVWEYINPADPGLGKQQSTTLAPDGAGATAVPGANLHSRNLTMAYLIGADLANAFAYSANLSNAELSQANLSNAKLGAYPGDPNNSGPWDGASLAGANLAQANLANADFSGYYAYNADAPDPVNNSIYYYGASVSDANFTGAEVRGANFTGSGGISLAQLYSTASYQARDLTGIRLPGGSLAGANFAGQNLTNADFSGFQISSYHELYITDLTAANLTNARFSAASFNNANLSGADARGADLTLTALGAANTTNFIQSTGHIGGVNLAAGASLIVRDYDGNSAATPPIGLLPIVVDQHLTMDGVGTLQMVFDADPWDSTISFAPGIPVALGGTLDLTFAPGVDVASQSGRTIDLFDWTGVTPTGTFTVTSPYTWNLTNLYTTGEVTLAAAPSLPGDFNNDAAVDAADYVVWRKGLGTTYTQFDYNTWQANFGTTLASGSGATGSARLSSPKSASANPAIPEPTSLALLLLAVAALFVDRRMQQVSRPCPTSCRSISPLSVRLSSRPKPCLPLFRRAAKNRC